MIFKNLELVSFRNYEREVFELLPTVNIFVGKNGQGKTNILESLYVLARGHSFRASSVKSLIRNEDSQAVIKATIEEQFFRHLLSLNISANKLKYSLDSKRSNLKKLSELLHIVLFSPESLSAIKGSPEQRRNLIDDFLWTRGSEWAECLQTYQKILRTRNRLLRDFKMRTIAAKTFEKTLESVNELFLPLATRLIWERIESLKIIIEDIRRAFQNISGRLSVDISVDYLISGKSVWNLTYQDLHDALRAQSTERSELECSAGTSLVGPHKHDIALLFDGNDSRYYCSQGQQRALILAFKMAQIMYHYRTHKKPPVLFLDDVFSEFDIEKQEHLMLFLKGIDAQVFLTSTDLLVCKKWLDRNVRVFTIESGKNKKG